MTPWLLEARRNRAVSLRHTPDGAPRLAQRSRLIAPLIVQRELLGYIYADIDGAFGRFHDGDRDLLAMLASQAAVALANVRFAAGLERKVAERTAELEQRAGELTIINSIQQGIAGSLDFQGIVDLVGDKLRKVLKSDDIGISWIDHDRRIDQALYASSMASACRSPRARSIDSDERWARICARRTPRGRKHAGGDDRGRQRRRPGHRPGAVGGDGADRHQRPACRHASPWRTTSAKTRSANPRCAC